MVKGHRSYRQAAKLGVFAMSLMLALAVPCIAFAANTASFSSATPGSGSTISVYKPSISVVVYDKYGVFGPTNNSMTVDGVKKQAALSRFSGWGNRKFRMSYPNVPTLAPGLHTVTAWVRDAKGKTSTYTWKFTVADKTAPVTTNDALPGYTAAGFITLAGSDDVAMGHTYYRLDGGLATLYSTPISVGWPGTHLNETHFVEFWSVDAANNAEAHHTVSWVLGTSFTVVHALPADTYCTDIAGCHATLGTSSDVPSLTVAAGTPVADLAKIHKGECFVCHGDGAPTTNNCFTCHGLQGPHGTHAAITSTSTPACTSAGCHTGSVTTVVHATCSTCHDPIDRPFTPRARVLQAIADGNDHCEACHGEFTQAGHAGASTASHNATPFAALGCFGNGCHQTDALVIHTTTLPGGPAAPGCAACHAGGKAPSVTTVNCAQAAPCHGNGTSVDINAIHTVLPAAHVSADSCTGLGNTATPCHVTNVATIHTTTLPGGPAAAGCVACHAPAKTASTVCANCHAANPHTGMTGGLPAVAAHNAATNAYWSGCSASSDCHNVSSDASVIHSIWAGAPGCKACHAPSRTPSVDCFTAGCHPADFHGTNQTTKHTFTALPAACADCHSNNLQTEHATYSITCAACHTSTDARVVAAIANGTNACDDCHSGTGSNANLNSDYHGAEFTVLGTASGHNVAGLSIGAKTLWDGSEGVVVKDSTGATITQEWPLPTASVFWSQTKALAADGSVAGDINSAPSAFSLNPTDAPAVAMANRGGTNMANAINTGLGWGSVVTCSGANGCHDAAAGIQATGPHGSTQSWAVDSNFPDDWTKAEITSFDPTGMRSIETTRGSGNPYYTQIGSNVYMPSEVVSGTVVIPIAGTDIETAQKKKYGAPVSQTTTNAAINPTITVYPGGFYGETTQTGTGYASATKTGRFICQKCHKLANSYQGLSIEGNGRGFRDNNYNYIGMSNEAHMEHHNDLTTGQGNCVSCHIAIPHGWKRPRLLVYESDPAPYKVQYVWPNYRSTDVAVLSTDTPDLSQGNWGWLNKAPNGNALTTGSRYQDITLTNAYTGTINSTHIDKISASATAIKELEVGVPALEYGVYDSSPASIPVSWGKWLQSAQGVIWPGDTASGTAKITLTVYDQSLHANRDIANGEAPIQNNCNGCTSASAGTHAPQAGPGGSPTSGSNEGVNSGIPYWK